MAVERISRGRWKSEAAADQDSDKLLTFRHTFQITLLACSLPLRPVTGFAFFFPAQIGFDVVLLPVVAGVGQALVHYGVEAGVLLDEDLAEGAVLAEQDSLQADQFQQGQEDGDQARSERVWLSRRRKATGLSSMVRRRARNWIIWPTVTESSSTSKTGRERTRSRISRKMRTRSTVSAAISGSADSRPGTRGTRGWSRWRLRAFASAAASGRRF